jgi:2-oxoglutarate ferredoxin oxidoreductase subunit delta
MRVAAEPGWRRPWDVTAEAYPDGAGGYVRARQAAVGVLNGATCGSTMAASAIRAEGLVMTALALQPPSRVRSRRAAWSPLLIEATRCKGCELCVAACPHGALALEPRTVNRLGYRPVRLVAPEKCTSCAFCARVCPDTVFTVFAPPRTTVMPAAPVSTLTDPATGKASR